MSSSLGVGYCVLLFVFFVQCWDVPIGDNSDPYINENFHQWTPDNGQKCSSDERAQVECLQRCSVEKLKPALGKCNNGYAVCVMSQLVRGPWLQRGAQRFGAPYFGGNKIAKVPCNDDRECAVLCDTLCNVRETTIFPIGDKSRIYNPRPREMRGCTGFGLCVCALFKKGYLKPEASIINNPKHKDKKDNEIKTKKKKSTKRNGKKVHFTDV